MLSDQPDRKRLSGEKVIKELTDNAGTQFDPVLVLTLLEVIAENNLVNVSDEVLAEAKSKVHNIIKSLSIVN